MSEVITHPTKDMILPEGKILEDAQLIDGEWRALMHLCNGSLAVIVLNIWFTEEMWDDRQV